jgi:hypothetical protein
VEVEKLGIPSVTLATEALASVGVTVIEAAGMPEYPLIVIKHPVAGLVEKVVRERITPATMDSIIKGLTVQPQRPQAAAAKKGTETLVYEAEDYFEAMKAMNDDFMSKDWGDGLPLVPPTRKRVQEMLAAAKRVPTDVIGIAGPRKGTVTVENIAVNAVMAGCRPEYMPVLITMMEAAVKPEFDLYRQCVTTQPVAPMVIVSGPITDVSRLNINSGVGVYGPGWQANATLGRTLRLLMLNTGGAVPGEVNKSTLGQFARYTAAWAVNREVQGFPSLQEQIYSNARRNKQVTKYYELEKLSPPRFEPIEKDENVVILFALGDRNNVNDNNSKTGEGVLDSVATAMFTAELPRSDSSHGVISGSVLVAFGPQHAEILAKEGWTLERMRKFLFQKARYPLEHWRPAHSDTVESVTKDWNEREAAEPFAKDGMVTMVEHPDNIYFTVAGGPGSHSAVFLGVYAPPVMQKIKP